MTTFVCHKGLYKFRVMPFGLVNAPATFTRVIRKLLEGKKGLDNYLDDILTYTTTWEGHIASLKVLFECVRQANISLKLSKCVIGESDVAFLGYQIGKGILQPKSNRVSRILEALRPVTKKQVRTFISLIGFYRKFVPNFTALGAPLTDLTR